MLPENSTPKHNSLEQRIRKLARRYRARQRRLAKRVDLNETATPTRRAVSWARTSGLVVLAILAFGRAPAATFETANANFAAGHYADAARGFEQVIAERGYSAPVLFNLGNAWLKTGQPGRAILNYERALRLAPDDAAISANLQRARQQAGLTANENQFREKVARVLSMDTLAWMLVGSSAIICAVVLAGRLLPVFPRRLRRGLAVGAVLGVVVAGAGIAVQWPERQRAVVLAANAEAHIAPAAAAGVRFKLAAGETVRAERSHNGYTLIRLRDGRSGWVPAALVERV